MGRIGIYGGSFNPPHVGHLRAARQMIEALDLDQLLLIPASIPPHKALAAGSPDGMHRLAMTQFMSQEDPRMTASSIELEREGASYTADTLRQLRRRYPKDDLFLLMGTDMFLTFHEWREPEQICEMAALVLALREQPDDAERRTIVQQHLRLERDYSARIIELNNAVVEMSSSQVRRMLTFGCAERFLLPDIMTYILENRLYGTGIPCSSLPFEELKKRSLELHKPQRIAHVIGCSETAGLLAERWGADRILAERAGILHDVTKALCQEDHLTICDTYGLPLTDFERENDKLLHAKSGSAVARQIFGECDAVCEAIRWHTTGKADMSTLEKIVYLADYMEPSRNFPGVEALRKLAEIDLDQALLLAFEMSIVQLERRGKVIDPFSRAARDDLRQKLGTQK